MSILEVDSKWLILQLLTNPLKLLGLKNTRIQKTVANGFFFFYLELAKYGGYTVFKGNLDKKDIDNLNIEDPFVREVIEIWSETFFEKGILSKDHFLVLPLWQNWLIRINTAPVLCKDWLCKGITQVKYLMDDSNNFLSLASFQNKYQLKSRPLTFLGISLPLNFSETDSEVSAEVWKIPGYVPKAPKTIENGLQGTNF